MEINDNKQLILLFSYHLFISGFGFRQISGIRCVSIWIFPYICKLEQLNFQYVTLQQRPIDLIKVQREGSNPFRFFYLDTIIVFPFISPPFSTAWLNCWISIPACSLALWDFQKYGYKTRSGGCPDSQVNLLKEIACRRLP